MLYRRYADTGDTSVPFPPTVDARGHRRCAGNRRLDTLVQRQDTYRGEIGQRMAQPPAHLQNALSVVCRRPCSIDTVASCLNVSTNTAWSYVCRVVDHWPMAADCAACLVCADLMSDLRSREDVSGSLTHLMKRLPPHATHALRTSVDRYAHLRLGRLCIEAQRAKKNIR